MKVSLIQMNSGNDKNANIEKAFKFMKASLKDNPDIICISEYFLHCGENKTAEKFDSDIIKKFCSFAKENNTNLILGSIWIVSDNNMNTNTTLVINRSGEIIHKYDKIYMYTVDREDLKIDEGKYTKRGTELGLFELDGIKIGLGICFDLRFPEYFRKLYLEGAELIFLPSSFRKTTGKIAWEYLTVARAVENQLYFCACNQTGGEGLKARCGNSKIISYNGEIISAMNEEEGHISATIDIEALRKYRKELPTSKQIIDI